jgi:hypothetical protein
MSSAKQDTEKFSLCLHIRKFLCVLFHRAKPVSEGSRRIPSLHCGLTVHSNNAPCHQTFHSLPINKEKGVHKCTPTQDT